MKFGGVLGSLFILFFSTPALASQVWSVKAPSTVLKGVPFRVEVSAPGLAEPHNQVELHGKGLSEPLTLHLEKGEGAFERVVLTHTGKTELLLTRMDQKEPKRVPIRALPGFFSLLPPLFAIALALLMRNVLVSLFAGIWLGAFFLYDFNPLVALGATMDHFVVGAVADLGHASILIFTLTMGGLVSIIYRNGGTVAIVKHLSRYASNAKRGQLATWSMGLLIFFDDYSNTLIVGNTMRPLTDKLRISREKLSFIVDATAAPVASVALISTWIGTEVGLIGDALAKLPKTTGGAFNPNQMDPYWVFVQSIPYCFYPILMLIFGFLVASSGRDFFSMAKAERRARTTGEVSSEGADIPYSLESEEFKLDADKPRRAINAILPISVMVLVTLLSLWITGRSSVEHLPEGLLDRLRVVIGGADSYKALLWSSLAGTLVAMILSVSQGILNLKESIEAFVHGLKSMMMACVILVLAWGIGAVTHELHTPLYLTQAMSEILSPSWLPVLVFFTAGITAFSTGTSWGTMAILIPIVIPLAHALGVSSGLPLSEASTILVSSVSSVLAGAVFGDHCSPISDTTVMSSLASGCDHIDHVRTQMPYALLVAVVAVVLGNVASGFGVSPWLSITLGTLVLWLVVRFVGKPNESVN